MSKHYNCLLVPTSLYLHGGTTSAFTDVNKARITFNQNITPRKQNDNNSY